MSGKGYLYYAHTLPGLQKVAWTEVQQRLTGASFEGLKEIYDKNGFALFRYAGDPASLLKLRTCEDVFFLVARIPKVEWGHKGLSQIHDAILNNRFLDYGLSVHGQVAHRVSKKRLTFRIISRMVGKKQPYRRLDFQRTVEQALTRRSHSKWQPVDEGEDIEIWANLIGLDFVCGLRLSDATMRHRGYKTAHIAASLRPSVAASMVWLSGPQAGDVFLDPMCGAGTLLVERGLIERHRLLLGGDLHEDALNAAAENIGPKHKPRQLFEWDAGRLPLAPNSVDKVATNLPFGKKIGSHEANVGLYRAFFHEADRVLRPKGRAVVLSSEANLLKDTIRRTKNLRIAQTYSVTILGQQAGIYQIERPR